MCFSCISCDGKCTPHVNNKIGVHIQEYGTSSGWRKISDPYRTSSDARESLALIPNDGMMRRIYSTFSDEDKLIEVYR